MTADVREGAAQSNEFVRDDEAPKTAAEAWTMAQQAEAEAAEAEALAAAAHARARAIQLRRLADVAEADTATTTAPEGETEDADSERQLAWYRRWRRRPKLTTVAAILAISIILASVAGSIYMVLEHRDASQQRQRVAEFAAAARQGVVTLTSLDFKNAKQGVQRILNDSTGSFKDEFQRMADGFAKVVEESKVVEQGTVQATAVDLDSMTSDTAVVLVASESEVTNAAGAKQDPRRFRLIVTVSRDGDQIKMSKVQFVP